MTTGLFGVFPLSELSNLTEENIRFLDKDGNNLPMIILKSNIAGEPLMKLLIPIYDLGYHDTNHENKNGNTVVDWILSAENLYGLNAAMAANIILCLKHRGYKKDHSSFNRTEDERLLKVLRNEPIVHPTRKVFQRSEFEDTAPVILAKGTSFGNIYTRVLRENNEIYVVKASNGNVGSDQSDVYKEEIFSRIINKRKEGIAIKVFGWYKGSDEKTAAIVMERGFETLENYLLNIISVPMAIKKNLLMRIFRQLTTKVAELNEMGIIHADLKPPNIMVMFDGSLRLIDFGISICRGIRPDLFDNTKSTAFISVQNGNKEERTFKVGGIVITEIPALTVPYNYSVDMHAITCMFFHAVLEIRDLFVHQPYLTAMESFKFKRNMTPAGKQFNMDLIPLTRIEEYNLNNFDPHFKHFVLMCGTQNNFTRLTAKQALRHPLFSGKPYVDDDYYPYEVTDFGRDIGGLSYYQSMSNRGITSSIMSIFENFKGTILPASTRELNMDLETIIYKRYANFNAVVNNAIFFMNTGNELYRPDRYKSYFNVITSQYANLTLKEIPLQNEYYRGMVESDHDYIFPDILIEGFIYSLQLLGTPAGIIRMFYNNIYSVFCKFVTSVRPYPIKIITFLKKFKDLIVYAYYKMPIGISLKPKTEFLVKFFESVKLQ